MDIPADAYAVWPFVADPALQKEWNPKIVTVKREAYGPASMGEHFETIYRMSGKEGTTQVLVKTCEPPRHIVFEHRMPWQGREQIFLEEYHIAESPTGVRVTQVLDLSQARIPWFFRGVIWIISRFGKPADEPTLEALKRAVASRSGEKQG